MASKKLSRRQKAMTIVPLAIVSGVWTASLAGLGTAATAVDAKIEPKLPDGATVPSQAIQAPANITAPGVVAPGVPNGATDSVVDGASTSGIPSAALSAYQRGAQIINSADTTCKIPWELIAAIGRVESDHGRYGGNVLSAQGVSTPGIYGIPLDGTNGTTKVPDTDAGQLDKDPVWDRAVGPMQFIPSTWNSVKVDADGDGIRNPQDIDDASLATAVYLCSGSGDLSTTAGQRSAVYRYNHSQSYVDLVLRLMQAYSQGDYTAVPNSTTSGSLYSLATPGSGGGSFATGGKAAKGGKATKGGKGGGGSTGTRGGAGSTGGGSTAGSGGAGSAGSGSSPGGGGGVKVPGSTNNDSGGKTVKDLPKDPVGTVTSGVDQVTKPTQNLLSYTAALALCQTELSKVRDPLGLLGSNAAARCAGDVQGKTADAARDLIPNTLQGLLNFLGL